jgi:Protein of unknown function (DUF2975)
MPTPKNPVARSVQVALAVVTVLFAVVATYGAFLLVNDAVGLARHGDTLVGTVPLRAQISPAAIALPSDAQTDGAVTTTLQVANPSGGQVAFAAILDAGNIAYYLGFLWLLRGIAVAVRKSEPFAKDVANRLRAIGLLLLVGSPILQGISTAVSGAMVRRLPVSAGLSPAGYEFPDGAIVAGIVALALAHVFLLGMRFREDSEATI